MQRATVAPLSWVRFDLLMIQNRSALLSTTITSVILIARWAIYLEGSRYKHESGKTLQLVDDKSTETHHRESLKVARRSLLRTISRLQQLDKSVTVIASVPEIGWDTPIVLAKSAWRGKTLSIAPSKMEHQQRQSSSTLLLTDMTIQKGVLVLNPDTLLCPDKWCRVQANGYPLYIDEDHLSSAGAKVLVPLVHQVLRKITPSSTEHRRTGHDPATQRNIPSCCATAVGL